jgi:hypothetical protein
VPGSRSNNNKIKKNRETYFLYLTRSLVRKAVFLKNGLSFQQQLIIINRFYVSRSTNDLHIYDNFYLHENVVLSSPVYNMSKLSIAERNELKRHVLDSTIRRLTTKETQEYIRNKRNGSDIITILY